MSNDDTPPSPYIVWPHVWLPAVPSQVPLSCVPPWTSFGFRGFTDSVWNCSVDRPVLRLSMCVGILASELWHAASDRAPSPRVAQTSEPSTSDPLERTTPPSEPSKNCSGFDGFVTSACWSGWIPFCVPLPAVLSAVWSYQCAPASSESRTVRPL